ncbi:MAG TPA: hypothetical protein VLG25_02920 [Patescibacteria group bacterium]|nr:hypothetical protein [Patescibacteria group bacterium]
MKWPFKRTENNQVPEEVQQYYQAEQRERVGVAWLLALATLVVTVLVALGLLWGGRWTYRKITHKNNSSTSGQVAKAPEVAPAAPANQSANSTNTNAPSTPSSNQTADNTVDTNTTDSNLPNTGPAGAVTAFVVTTVLGTAFYQLRLRRQIN